MAGMSHEVKLVVGTAGHIDHGKSRLVWALTGLDPDRLPEEKARGMTIDLGFGHLAVEGCDIWFVDVPGHERFIRNMLAGASGVDVALLVVAADDSVMPQTREHAEVLSLLGVERCVVVLTKMDLVDDEWADQVEEEVRGLLAPLGLSPLACVRTSAESGRGLDELRALLARLAREQSTRAEPARWFCLPIDRAFVVAGRGTVVTGTVAHGSVQRDAELEVWPAGLRARVRDLQVQHHEREVVQGRLRLAVNLAGVAPEQASRGCTLATPGYLEPSRLLDAWIAWLRMPGKQRRQTLRLRLHIATSEVLAELRLADPPTADTVRGQCAQLRTAQPVVAAWGQRFILRDESGMRTLGGGRVLRPVARVWTSRRPAHREGLQRLLEGTPPIRFEEVLRAAEWQPLDERHLAVRAGLEDEPAVSQQAQRLMGGGRIRLFESAAQRLYAHNALVDALGDDLVRRLKKYMQDNPRLPGLPRPQWVGWMPGACPARLRPVLAEFYFKNGRVTLAHDHVVPVGEKQALGDQDERLLEQMLAEFHAGAFQPPALEELRCRTPRNERRLRELIELAVTRGQLVRIADGIWLHGRRWEELVALITGAIRAQERITVAEIRTRLNSSRKYVVPIAERLDATGITRRVDDYRVLGPKAPPMG